MMQPPVYSHTTELASGIPLGGLGTGSVELRADGRFHDWEIFNNYLWSGAKLDAPPEMWSEDAFFALRAKPAGEHPRVRLLYDDETLARRRQLVSAWHALVPLRAQRTASPMPADTRLPSCAMRTPICRSTSSSRHSLRSSRSTPRTPACRSRFSCLRCATAGARPAMPR